MGALVANGWYSGHIGNGGYQFFGKVPVIFAQLAVTYSDGTTEYVITDGSWKSERSPILAADFMLGEREDARLAIKGWDEPGLNDASWSPTVVHDGPQIAFDAQVMEPARQVLELKPKILPGNGTNRWLYDFGQNMVGVIRLKMNAPAGTQVTLRHAEMLNPDGTIYTNNLRGAPSVDTYVCAGGHSETWQPRFTFHGFRYVEVTGLNHRPSPDDVTGVVIASDNHWTGTFSCSDTRLNQLQSNIQWGQRGNYISIPTDCPQRDERLGWMGDAEIFVRTATYNADVASFFTKWLVDVDDGQQADGSFGDVSPNTGGGNGAPAWGDAGVICPWTIYQAYGDKRILDQHLPAMMRWIQYLEQNSHDFIRDTNRGGDFGDWLAIGADTSKELIGTAFFAHSADLVAQSCLALGRTDDAERYQQLFQKVKAAFNQRYVTADGHVRGETQCGYILALRFNLLPEESRAQAAQYLADDIKAKGNHLSTGFVGVSHLLPVLANAGKPDVAGDLLRQDTFPSWLFSVKHGATTIWERWDGWTPEKGFEDPGMNSFNHYSLGSCGQYFFEYIGGIQAASPGFKTIRIAPVIGSGLTWANTTFQSDHGRISTEWNYSGNLVTLRVTIPANTTATVQLPADDVSKIRESGQPLDHATGVSILRQEGKNTILNIQSGSYDFTSELETQS
jgi:alpha-L-rhamnosidase